MTSKQEAEALMNEMLALAKHMLREHGEFFPYGGYMKPNGEIVHVGAGDSSSDHPKSKELIAILQNSLKKLANEQQCKAIAIVYDVVVSIPESNHKGDAIQICIDHMSNYSAEVFFPYHIDGNEVKFGKVFAQHGKRFFS